MDIGKLVEKVIGEGGNEIQLKISSKPLMRKNKLLRGMDLPTIVEEDVTGVLTELLPPEELKKVAKKTYFETNIFGKLPANIRLTVFHAQEKPVLIIKIISNKMPTLKDIGFPDALVSLIESRKGLFIVTGPARSGISTTIAAIVEHLNNKFSRHIITIEDPIEFNFESKKSRITQRQIGKDILDFNQGLNFAKKMDVDTFIISDIKQTVPFKSILELVAGGSFVILAMSSLGFVAAIEKFVFDFPEEHRDYVWQVLADNLLGVCSQALIATKNASQIVPAFEILIMNSIAAGIIQKGKASQLEGNIMNLGMGSALFGEYVNHLILKNAIDRPSADAFLELLRSTKV